MRSLLVGVDIGTSAVKVQAVSAAGITAATALERYALATPRPAWVEQDAEAVYRATMQALQAVLAEIRASGGEVAAIGLSSAMHGVVPVDARGEPLGPFVTWLDRRAAAVADRWRADGTAEALYARTGAPMHPMLPTCKLRWFAEHDAATVARAAKFVSIKELLTFRWTGEWLVDWGIASGTGLFDVRERTWSAAALEAAGVSPAQLSNPAPPSTLRYVVRAAAVEALGLRRETAVALASSDGALANLGVGAVGDGELALTLGTSGAVRAVVERPLFDARGRTFAYVYDDQRYLAGGPTSSAGAVLAKLQDLFMTEVPRAERFSRAVTAAEAAAPGGNGLSVMPFLAGERAPYWRSELRGGIAGLDLTHSRGDIMRAAFESVVFGLAGVCDVLSEQLPKPARVRLSGGLCRAPFVRQLIADVFGCEAVQSGQAEASAFGAAMMAGIATGALAGDGAVAALLPPVHVHQPRPDMVRRYADIFARYRAVVDANLPLYPR